MTFDKRVLWGLSAVALVLLAITLVLNPATNDTPAVEPTPSAEALAPIQPPAHHPASPQTAGAAGGPAPVIAQIPAKPTEEDPYVDCNDCREKQCSDFRNQGVNVLDGCYKKVNPQEGADPNDPRFIDDCVALVKCAQRTRCAEQPGGMAHCYCGTGSIDDCIEKGPESDAPCINEFRRATRTRNHAEITERFSNYKYPAAWGVAVMDCETVDCHSKCTSSAG